MIGKGLLGLSSILSIFSGHMLPMGITWENLFLIYGYVIVLYFFSNNGPDILYAFKGLVRDTFYKEKIEE